MKKTILTIALFSFGFFGMTSCSSEGSNEAEDTENNTEVEAETEEEEPEPEEEVSALGNFEGLVGEWTIDAATAGVQLDLTFGEDGSFAQKMGEINATGTWEVVSEDRIKLVTQNTKGQEWLVTDLTETTVNVCWNPDKPNPKTMPMQRVK